MALPQLCVHYSILLSSEKNKNAVEGRICSLPTADRTFIFSFPWYSSGNGLYTKGSLAHRPLNYPTGSSWSSTCRQLVGELLSLQIT